MKASISFIELQDILAENAKLPISLAFVDDKTIHASAVVSLGFIKKTVEVNLRVIDLTGSDLLVGYSGGFGMETLVGTALNLLKDKIPTGLLDNRGNGQLMIHLGQIDQVKGVFEKIDVRDISVLNEGIQVEGKLK
ncbi:MAG: hypothetical protein MJZ94_03210 [Bacteroidales bacterium]|nr:hypothetical protein [Bacteroidales bacterium]